MSELTLDVGLAAKLKQGFGRNGWTEKRIDEICEGDKLGRILRFVENGYQLSISGPNTLVIDRSHPFNPTRFIGKGWTIEEQDERALALTEIDFSKVRFESGLKEGEAAITGEEKLKRLKAGGVVRLDAKIGQTLYEENGQATLRFIHEHFGISWLELAGTVLRHPDGRRYCLYLCRYGDDPWRWRYGWLDYDRRARTVSPVFAS